MLNNNNITLRAPEPADLENLYRWENNTDQWDAGNTRQPYSRFQLKEYLTQIDKTIYENGSLRLIIELNSTHQAVGTVDLYDFDLHNSRIALGLFVDTAFRGNGIATQALELTEAYVFDFLQLNQLYCQISDNNMVSKQMFEHRNYETSAMLKKWIRTSNGFCDVLVFQQLKENYMRITKKIID